MKKILIDASVQFLESLLPDLTISVKIVAAEPYRWKLLPDPTISVNLSLNLSFSEINGCRRTISVNLSIGFSVGNPIITMHHRARAIKDRGPIQICQPSLNLRVGAFNLDSSIWFRFYQIFHVRIIECTVPNEVVLMKISCPLKDKLFFLCSLSFLHFDK